MIGSALCYVALSILGEGPDSGNGAVARARKWILDNGGATGIPSWGKTYLSVCVYTYKRTYIYIYIYIYIYRNKETYHIPLYSEAD